MPHPEVVTNIGPTFPSQSGRRFSSKVRLGSYQKLIYGLVLDKLSPRWSWIIDAGNSGPLFVGSTDDVPTRYIVQEHGAWYLTKIGPVLRVSSLDMFVQLPCATVLVLLSTGQHFPNNLSPLWGGGCEVTPGNATRRRNTGSGKSHDLLYSLYHIGHWQSFL